MYRRSGRGRVLLLVFLALSIFVITLDYRQGDEGPLDRARDITVAIVAPIQRGITAVFRPVGDFFSSIGEITDLKEKNTELQDELERTEAQIDESRHLADENAQLTRLLELQKTWSAMDTVAAQVIGKPSSNYKWALFINKGRADGLRADMAVVHPNGLVGKVVKADSHTSTILLLVDPQAAAGARVEEGRDTGVVTGHGISEPLFLELIDPNSEVSVYDKVETSGYDRSIFPPGIPVGVVTEVVTGGGDVEQKIEVEPFVDFTALDYVLVLLETGPDHAAEGK